MSEISNVETVDAKLISASSNGQTGKFVVVPSGWVLYVIFDGRCFCYYGWVAQSTEEQLAGAIGTSVVTTIVSSEQTRFPKRMAFATMLGTRNALYLLFILACMGLMFSIIVFHNLKRRIDSV